MDDGRWTIGDDDRTARRYGAGPDTVDSTGDDTVGKAERSMGIEEADRTTAGEGVSAAGVGTTDAGAAGMGTAGTGAAGTGAAGTGKTVLQSKYTEGTATCPSCGATFDVVMWDRLEAACNPERAAQLATGSLLVARCPSCGAFVPLDYPLFYVDRERKVAAYYPAGRGGLDAVRSAFVAANIRFADVDLGSLRRPRRHGGPEHQRPRRGARSGLDESPSREACSVRLHNGPRFSSCANVCDDARRRHPRRARTRANHSDGDGRAHHRETMRRRRRWSGGGVADNSPGLPRLPRPLDEVLLVVHPDLAVDVLDVGLGGVLGDDKLL